MNAKPFVPPGGFIGNAAQTIAGRWSQAVGRAASPRARRRKKSKSAKRAKRAKRSGGRKLKFGSPAWRKKYMKRKR